MNIPQNHVSEENGSPAAFQSTNPLRQHKHKAQNSIKHCVHKFSSQLIQDRQMSNMGFVSIKLKLSKLNRSFRVIEDY